MSGYLTTGEHYVLEKDVVVVTSRDMLPDDVAAKATQLMNRVV